MQKLVLSTDLGTFVLGPVNTTDMMSLISAGMRGSTLAVDMTFWGWAHELPLDWYGLRGLSE